MNSTTLTHLAAMVLAGIGAVVLAMFGKVPGDAALGVLVGIVGIGGTTAAISSTSAPTSTVAPPTKTGTSASL